MTSPIDMGEAVTALYAARVAKARTVSAFMETGLMGRGPIAIRFSNPNEVERAAKELTGKSLEGEGVGFSVDGITRAGNQHSNDATYLWLEGSHIALDERTKTDLLDTQRALAAHSRTQAAKPWRPEDDAWGLGEDSQNEWLSPGFPITLSVGITGATRARLSVAVHSPRTMRIPKKLRSALKQLAASGFVLEERDIGALADDIPPTQFRSQKAEVLRPGYSISRRDGPASSIGLFVKRKGALDGPTYILGSGHALSHYGHTAADKDVLYVADGHAGRRRNRAIAEVSEVHFSARHRATQEVDAALAKLNDLAIFRHQAPVTEERFRLPPDRELELDEPVSVVGCTTGRRSGTLLRTDVDIEFVGRGGRIFRYQNQVECVNSVNAIGGAGDSGGIVVDRDSRVVAQITGWIREKRGGSRYGSVYATPIATVLNRLDIVPFELDP